MEMHCTPIVVEHALDDETVAEIQAMRELRFGMARNMLAKLDDTAIELAKRGLMAEVDSDMLRAELTAKCAQLEARLREPHLVYSDEISFYVDTMPDVEIS